MEQGERDFFTKVAQNYDRLSGKLSAGLDNIWRRRAVELASGLKSAKVLDVATGTGNIAIMLARKYNGYKITALDTNREMLAVAEEKSRGLKNVKYVHGSAESLGFAKSSFDVVITSFSLGAFDDLTKSLDEMKRVLRPGGRLIILDINKSHGKLFGELLGLYQMFSVAPTLNSDIRGELERYIHSKRLQIDKKMLISMLENTGFREINAVDLSFNTVFVISCRK